MEEQAEHPIPTDNQDSRPAPEPLTYRNPDDSGSRSVPTLRFPRPQGSQVLANWVSSSSPDIMASPTSYDDDSPLSESTFEFISPSNAEDSSQDERADSMSEPLSEYERYPHPDEVQAFSALDDMSNSAASTMATDSESDGDDDDDEDEDDEDEDDEDDAGADEEDIAVEGEVRRGEQSFSPFALADPDEILRNSLCQGSITRSFPRTASPSLAAHSIEFNEPEDVDVHIDKISVKHTVREFSEEEAAEFFKRVGLGDAPARVSATIRQTMSQKCLSTHEALRVLYLGDEAVKGEIILKVSRAITCSSSVDYNENKALRRNTEGVYNIVPVTFGAVKDRDVELMEASGFQIKVDTCLDADKIPIDSRYFRNDIIYSLTVDGENGGKKYKSVPAGGPEGARVQPAWALPHVAIFYCSEDDDGELQRIQKTSWEFCRRHAIPTLFISDHPAFASPIASRWINYTNEHAVCLSLESRGWWTEHRFPIDLTSFLNIDNRQMNQNLAYLTGLQEPAAVDDEKTQDVQSLARSLHERWLDLLGGDLKGLRQNVYMLAQAYVRLLGAILRPWQSAVSLSSLVTVILFLSFLLRIFQGPLYAPSDVSTLDGSSPAPSVLTAATSTVTVSHVSTKTVSIGSTETSSIAGPLSNAEHEVPAGLSRPVAVQLNNEEDIMVKFYGNKGIRLANAGLSAQVFRDDTLIRSELLVTSGGIVVEIPDKEKRGVVNVTIVTTRKPDFNETFAVDFGGLPFWHLIGKAGGLLNIVAQTLGDSADEAVKNFENDYAPVLASAEGQVKDTAASWYGSIKDASKAAGAKYSAYENIKGVGRSAQGYRPLIETRTEDYWAGLDSAVDSWYETLLGARKAGQDKMEKMKDAGKAAQAYSSHKAGETFGWVKDSIRPDTVLKNVQHAVNDQLRHVEGFRDEGKLAVLKAQVASKLWWLKVQGKTDEYEEYERRARSFMAQKHTEAVKVKKLRETEDTMIKCPRTGSSICHCKDKGVGRWKV